MRQAREQSVDTAGVQSSGEIPEYLTARNSETQAVLDALRLKEKKEEEKPAEPEAPKVDTELLKNLSAVPAEEKPAEPDKSEAEKEAQRAANELLANKFGKKE